MEIRVTVDERRKLADTERQRVKDLQATIDARQAMTLIMNIGRIIKEHVSDRPTLLKIAREIDRLSGSHKLLQGHSESE